MATVLMVPLMLYLLAVLAGRHVHCKSTGAAADGLYDVTEYGAAPSRKDNKDVSALLQTGLAASCVFRSFLNPCVVFPCHHSPPLTFQAFLAAWRAACSSTAGNATLLIPEGTFAVGAVEFSGPCKSGGAPVVVIDGVLRPCTGGCHLTDDDWITFSALSNLLVTGAGTLDGQGGARTNNAKTTTLELDGVTNSTVRGLRVGSLGRKEGEEDSNITFEDIIMADVSNPILIDQRYCPHGRCSDVDKPSRVQISDVTFRRIQGTSSSKVAVQLRCSEEQPCSGVRLDGINLRCGDQPCHAQFANVRGAPALEAQAPSLWVQEAHGLPSDAE
ncbi:Exopolygalacturonase [Triticum urartu]|uniref:Exopolygalacturonase n=1 Tax=Triticum urartu TaxID=4572 RepID=M8A750_TRIUA|nr:Exopolygalacturonase [Triticum urartu]